MRKLSTREYIEQTILELLQEKSIENVSVSEITQEVGISPKTFYNYFKDKFDACNALYDAILDNCWITDGRRSSLDEFFRKFEDAVTGERGAFFVNTMYYTGQSSINEHIVERGVRDLREQLVLTGHGELVTEETEMLLEFYLRGLTATLQAFNKSGKNVRELILHQDKTRFLPRELYDALKAMPIN